MREFIVELTTTIPEGTEQSEVDARRAAENVRVKELTATGHLARLWWLAVLGTLPLRPWMDVKVTALRPHHNDPTAIRGSR
ncbi:muconolactone D-isomerase [Nocardia sp. GAS34]|uniref:muconolactone Delta-isomerase family protein n=1 Tax=unclassified Nocardia TaxID=2637762 RepID=UPI003D25BFBE